MVAAVAFALVTSGAVGGAAAVPQWHQETVVADAGFIDDPVQAPGSTLVYGLVQVPGSITQYRLQVLDLTTKRLVRGLLVYGGSELVTVGDHVDLIEPTSLTVAKRQFVSPYAVHVIDPATARLGPAVPLPAAGRPLAGLVLAPDDPVPAGGLWVAFGRAPVLLSSETGAVLRRLRALPATIGSLVVAPDGRRLYVEVGLTRVDELNATNGAVLASRVLYTSSAFVDAATPAGVWVIASTGMANAVEHLSSSGLVLSGLRAEAGSPGWDPYIGVVKLLGGAAWLVSGAGIACADPSGTALRGGEWFSGVAQSHNFGAATDPFVPIAALGKDIYAVRGNTYGSQPGDVILVTTPAPCWGGSKNDNSAAATRGRVSVPDVVGKSYEAAQMKMQAVGPPGYIRRLNRRYRRG
jgi:hypothetical protein